MRARDGLAWCVLVLALAGHWLLFAAYVRREVAWSYAAHFDQTAVLFRAYRAYDTAQREGVVPALTTTLRTSPATGVLLPLLPLPLFAWNGPSRLAALAVNWLAFAALQAGLAGAARRLGRGWALPALALGLLWSAAVSFVAPGGLDDFRADFVALCLYGLFVLAVAWSDTFRRDGPSVVAGLVAALAVLERTLTVVYLGGVLVAFAALLLARLRRATDGAGRDDARRSLRGLVLCAASLALAAPVLVGRAGTLWGYYVVGHVTGPERHVRALGVDVRTLLDAVVFYPRMLLCHQAGTLLLLGALALAALRVARRGGARPPDPAARDRATFAALCVAVPLVVLTLDTAKSTIVAGIVVPALAWLLVLAADALAARAAPAVLAAVAAVVCVAGGAYQVRRLTGPAPREQPVAVVQETLRMHDDVAAVCIARGWTRPRLLADRQRDYVPAIRVSAYERHRLLLDITQAAGPGVLAPADEALEAALRDSALVLVTAPGPADALTLPYDRALRDWHDRLRAHCDRERVRVGSYRVPEAVDLYAWPGAGIAHDP